MREKGHLKHTKGHRPIRAMAFHGIAFAYACQLKKPNSTPAATAEPITPATFGPIACINR